MSLKQVLDNKRRKHLLRDLKTNAIKLYKDSSINNVLVTLGYMNQEITSFNEEENLFDEELSDWSKKIEKILMSFLKDSNWFAPLSPAERASINAFSQNFQSWIERQA